MSPAAVSVRPAGSVPLSIVHVKVPVPPLAESVSLYAASTVAPPSDVVSMVTAGAEISIASPTALNAPALSVARTVNRNVPAAVGVPEIPPAGVSERPPGNEPSSSDHVNPPTPPVASRAALYAVPTVPTGNADVVTTTGGGTIVIVSGCTALAPELSCTRTVNGDGPVVVGVPVMWPSAASERPAGKEPPLSIHVLPPAPPSAASHWSYATPTVPLGNEVVVTLRATANTTVSEALTEIAASSETNVAVLMSVAPMASPLSRATGTRIWGSTVPGGIGADAR